MKSTQEFCALVTRRWPVSAPLKMRDFVLQVIRENSAKIKEMVGEITGISTSPTIMHIVQDDSASLLTVVDLPAADLEELMLEQAATNADLLRMVYNELVLPAFAQSNIWPKLMIGTDRMNAGPLHGFLPFGDLHNSDQLPRLDSSNYQILRQTRTQLNDRMIEGLVALLLKALILLEEDGANSKMVLALISDGYDQHSLYTAVQAKALHTVMGQFPGLEFMSFALGVSCPAKPDYRQMFGKMGIPRERIRTIGESASTIRRLGGAVTTGIIGFSQTGRVGGFGEAGDMDTTLQINPLPTTDGRTLTYTQREGGADLPSTTPFPGGTPPHTDQMLWQPPDD